MRTLSWQASEEEGEEEEEDERETAILEVFSKGLKGRRQSESVRGSRCAWGATEQYIPEAATDVETGQSSHGSR